MISSTGLGSGLDVNAIVTELMRIESRPLSLLQSAKSELNTQVSSFGSLQSRMATLRDRANELTSLTLWGQTVAKSQNESAVRVSTTSGAVAGSYAVHVERLAASQTVASTAFASSASTLNEGTLTIDLGSWDNEPAPDGFTPKAGGSPLVITIGAGETSLAAIRDKINGANAGVTVRGDLAERVPVLGEDANENADGTFSVRWALRPASPCSTSVRGAVAPHLPWPRPSGCSTPGGAKDGSSRHRSSTRRERLPVGWRSSGP